MTRADEAAARIEGQMHAGLDERETVLLRALMTACIQNLTSVTAGAQT